MPVVTKRESARLDLVEHFVYLAETASMHVADRHRPKARTSLSRGQEAKVLCTASGPSP